MIRTARYFDLETHPGQIPPRQRTLLRGQRTPLPGQRPSG